MDKVASTFVDFFWHVDTARGVLGNAIWGVTTLAAGAGLGMFLVWLRRRFVSRQRLVFVDKDWPGIAAAINKAFAGKATLIEAIQGEPILEVLGDLQIDKAVRSRANEIARERQHNSKNAVLLDRGDLAHQPAKWRVHLTPHTTVVALREQSRLPNVLSANALICCSKLNEVYLHYRSETVDTKKGKLHIFGGSYEHSLFKNDEESLIRTAEREVREESGASISIPKNWIGFVATENDTGFVQINYCGIEVAADSIDAAKKRFRAEGDVLACSFLELETVLTKTESPWVETGKAVLLAWLAIGAPTTAKPGFSATKAKQMYRNVMRGLAVDTGVHP